MVRVKEETAPIRLRKPHLRVPGYLFGLVGTIERECVGIAANPEHLAFREVPHALSSGMLDSLRDATSAGSVR